MVGDIRRRLFLSVYNGDRYLEKPSIQSDAGVRCGQSCGQSCSAHLQTRITSRCPVACVETGQGHFPSTPYTIHPPQHAQPPCWQLQAFSQTINCALSLKTHTLIRKGRKKSREVWFHWFFPTTIFKAVDDTTLCVFFEGFGLITKLPVLWVIRLFNTVFVDIRVGF